MRSALLLCVLLASGCRTAPAASQEPAASDAPYVLVLGSAQDGGLPHIGCLREACEAARRDPSRRRLVTSLLVADPRSGRRWLIDASPDLPEQVERSRGHPATRGEQGPRPPLFDGVFLTHAHIGHYLGLAHLGREAYGVRDLPVFASERMAAFLRGNGPWSLLVETGGIRLEVVGPGRTVELAEGLSVEAIVVPHRDEYSDTLAFVVRGPRRSLLYLPDIDKWERWERPLEEALAGVDVALLDATFFDADELPGRDLAEIPHPFVVETLDRLERAAPRLRGRVVLTHLNHSNPLCDPTSEASGRVRAAGLRVAFDGQVFGL